MFLEGAGVVSSFSSNLLLQMKILYFIVMMKKEKLNRNIVERNACKRVRKEGSGKDGRKGRLEGRRGERKEVKTEKKKCGKRDWA